MRDPVRNVKSVSSKVFKNKKSKKFKSQNRSKRLKTKSLCNKISDKAIKKNTGNAHVDMKMISFCLLKNVYCARRVEQNWTQSLYRL